MSMQNNGIAFVAAPRSSVYTRPVFKKEAHMRRCKASTMTLMAATATVCGLAVVPAQSGQALSPRNANYQIQVRLDAEKKTLEGSEVVTWRNIQDTPTGELPFHLYYNAWRNTHSTWLRERALGGGLPTNLRDDSWGYVEVSSVKLLGGSPFQGADLTPTGKFIAPDDGNTEDRTVLQVTLPRPVNPGEEVRIEIKWHSKIPRTFSRTGFRGNFFFVAQWFPKIGVFEAGGKWDCRQFHAATEFYSDYGVYDVRITVPNDFVLGATGRLIETKDNGDGSVTRRHYQEDVHDFAWTASPDYLVKTSRFEHAGLKPIDMRLLLQPEHEAQAERHFAATRAALQYYGSWYGEYPYGHITIVDPAYGSGAGGMEYPTLFTCGSRYFNLEGGGSPEGVTIHEAGHQFWYGIVGNNEFEHAWLDEGFNTFSTARTMDVAFGEVAYVRRYFQGLLPWINRDLKFKRMTSGNRLDGYRSAAKSDAQSTPTYQYFPGTASRITYDKTALWLSTLERHLGWETLQRILSTHFSRWKFRHPKPEDFFAVANEVSGQNLTPFFDQVHRSSNVFDYAVESVSTAPIQLRGMTESGGKLVPAPASTPESKAQLFRSQVVVRRLGEAIWPVEVLFGFENGEKVRETWDGQYRWKAFTFEKPSKLKYAVVDPDHKLLLDINYTNNSKLVSPQAKFPARKWASKWMIWLQDLMNTMAFFV